MVNGDYTPYSLKRDQKIESVCNTAKIPFFSFDDALLHPPSKTLKKDGKPYTVFTPFYHNAMQLEVSPPVANRYKNYYSGSIPSSHGKSLYHQILPTRSLSKGGGRTAALKILHKIGEFSSYASLRDFPAEDATTHLSAHLKFTTISPKELYWKISKELGPSSPLIRSLFWRDFFSSIALFFPRVFTGAFHEKYNSIRWRHDEKIFIKWCEGKTGFPIVDAGLREMNQTGFMHNRVRMIVASFLTKDLHIDWRLGEKYFAQTLVDYDPSVNNGNWQWAASTGCDAQPYFRIFNPWRQALKFDPDCVYIKKWIPELTLLPPNVIHKWDQEKYHSQYGGYPKPIVDHAKEAKATLALYK